MWAPDHQHVSAVVDGAEHRLGRRGDGVHSGVVPGGHGSRYGFRLGDDPRVRPDPASHHQPDGTDGLSAVVDHTRYAWRDAGWRGHPVQAHVIYELHCGTFTPEGTWDAARRRLPALAALGITTLLVMPANAYAGAYGWGYDGVFWFAPHATYGEPDAFKAFVDEAHAVGLAVVLDVVFNHLGPRDCVLQDFARDFFTTRYGNEWGASLNFDGEGSAFVRRFVTDCAAHWMAAYHLDGLRLDATQQMHDASPTHIIGDVVAAARRAARHRQVLIVGENEPQDACLFAPVGASGCGVDVLYNDDFHHAMRARLTGWRDAYLGDYTGITAELLSCVRHGFLFQGQHYPWQGKRRGVNARHVEAHRFLCFLENHDQVANADVRGRRLSELVAPALLRASTALLLLGPWTPLLFQGQERGSRQPWVYFADHGGDLGGQVRRGRREFVRQFARLAALPEEETGPDPVAARTFEDCRLDGATDESRDNAWWRLHADLLALRRAWSETAGEARWDGSAPTADLLLLRRTDADADHLVVVNFGSDMDIAPLADPLVAPPPGCDWTIRWSSEQLEYGGSGVPRLRADRWLMAGHATTLLEACASLPHPKVPLHDPS